MNAFHQVGEAMLLAEEGKAEIARAIAASLSRGVANFRAWLAKMPTTLPPTEFFRR